MAASTTVLPHPTGAQIARALAAAGPADLSKTAVKVPLLKCRRGAFKALGGLQGCSGAAPRLGADSAAQRRDRHAKDP